MGRALADPGAGEAADPPMSIVSIFFGPYLLYGDGEANTCRKARPLPISVRCNLIFTAWGTHQTVANDKKGRQIISASPC